MVAFQRLRMKAFHRMMDSIMPTMVMEHPRMMEVAGSGVASQDESAVRVRLSSSWCGRLQLYPMRF